MTNATMRSVAKVTGKLQITLPKALAERCGIRVGDDLELRVVGRSIQIDRRSPRDSAQLRRERRVRDHDDGLRHGPIQIDQAIEHRLPRHGDEHLGHAPTEARSRAGRGDDQHAGHALSIPDFFSGPANERSE